MFEGTVDDYAARTGRRHDTFLLMGHNLGLFQGRDRAPEMLDVIRRLANPGAVILGTIGDVYTTDRPVHLAYHDQNRRRGRLPGRVTMRVRYQDIAGDWFDYLYASLEEVEELVSGTGWSITHHETDGSTIFVVLGSG